MVVDGLSGVEVSKKMGVNDSVIYRWKKEHLNEMEGVAEEYGQVSPFWCWIGHTSADCYFKCRLVATWHLIANGNHVLSRTRSLRIVWRPKLFYISLWGEIERGWKMG